MTRAPLPTHEMPEPSKNASDSNLSRREALALMGGAALALLHTSCAPDARPAGSGATIDGPVHYAGLTDVARLIESKELSPVDLTQRILGRIESVDARLKSYATVMGDHALEAARAAEREIAAGNYRGPLHGIPVAVKDLCYTKGVRTMGGLGVRSDFVPDHDATVVAKLQAAGAIVLGKLNLTEGAMAGYHPDFDVPVNPWDDAYWPGASSSGSGVATAAGLCFAALGTDTGGSIRFPSMANGTVGLKPTYGRVSRYGVLPLGESLDHVGPMARRVADAAVMFEAIAGFDPNDTTSLQAPVPNMRQELGRGVGGLRIGFDRSFVADVSDPALLTAIEAALGELEQLGARVVDVGMPSDPELINTWFTICAYEAAAAHAATFPSQANRYGRYFREFLELGSAIPADAYAEASRQRAAYNERFLAALSQADAVACSAGGIPFPISEAVQRGGMADFDPVMPMVHMQFTIPADFAGTPALALPCGVSTNGLPLTIQFLGAPLSEPSLCRIGHAYEQATTWHTRHPSV